MNSVDESTDPDLEHCWVCDKLKLFIKGDIVIKEDKLLFVCKDCR